MEELFGLSMNTLMYVFSATFLVVMAGVVGLGLRNRIMLKMGLRNIPRRRGQTALIVIGVMLSTVIISAAFGTGDTLSFSIRNEAIVGLKHIDELVLSAGARQSGGFGELYFPYERYEDLRSHTAGNQDIDGLAPQIAESVPVQNRRTKLSEGQMRVVGLDPDLLDGFGDLELADGGVARLKDLVDDEVFISEEAAKELDARAGDQLDVFLESGKVTLTVRSVVERGGFAGVDPTMLLPLARAQEMFGRPGEINTIVVSNTGDERSGAEPSRDVAKELRVFFNDRAVATQLKEVFGQAPVLEALEKKRDEEGLGEELREELGQLLEELRKDEMSDELNSLLADGQLTGVVMEQLDEAELRDAARRAATLFLELAEFRVLEVKRNLLNQADEVGTEVTAIFVLFSSFSIMVGVLLIFLIFVMLAAARKYEMGMARALGAKRRHLVLMFVFEGTAYTVVSAAVGVVLGLAVSAIMVSVLNQIFSNLDEAFLLSIHFEPRSVIVAYGLGMVITFTTVAISAYRVSRLNIVVAIRGLPEAIIPTGAPPLLTRLGGLLRSVALPLMYLWAAARALVRRKFGEFARNVAMAVLVLFPAWLIAIIVGLLRVAEPYLLQGWLTLLSGAGITYMAITSWHRFSYFGAGISLSIIGLGLMARSGLRQTSLADATSDRVGFTAAGVAMLVFWAMPFSVFEGLIGDLERDFDIMFTSGIAMVGAAVWIIMYNADLMLRGLSLLTGRVGRLRPVLVTAVAYPMSAKFRTGLTLAMFALVVFTLMVMSVLTETFSTQFEEPRKVYAGFDVGGAINFTTPISDIRLAIGSEPNLRLEDFEAVGGYTGVPLQLRAVNGGGDRWRGRTGLVADDEFLASSSYDLKIVAEGYGPTSREVLQAMRDDPTLAVIGGWMLPTEEPTEDEAKDHLFGGLHYGADKMEPILVEAREPRSGEVVLLNVIAVYDRLHVNASRVLVSKEVVDDKVPFAVPVTNYRFRLAEGVDAKKASRALEASLLEYGMETEVFQETVDTQSAAGKAFFRLFTGFMSLGLLVGVAALGVISTRAVVERRQQIGVLRAIGFKRGMIQLSFLMESSFVSVLGSVIGLVLGMVLSYNAVTDISREQGIDTITFSVPWLQIGFILAVTYLFSLLTTFLPARQASRIYPAEALRYE
jgi:putative ABC transport system permease protein